MTALEQIQQSLAELDDQQLQQVANFVTQLKASRTPKKQLSDFYRAFASTAPYPGKVAIRQSITDYLAQKHDRTES